MNDLKPNKHYIISAKPDGLGMRLASILIGMYLAKKVDFIFAFTWSKSIDLDKYDVRTKKLKDLHYHANEMEHVESIFSKEFIAKYMIEKDFENSHGFLIAKNKKLNNIKLGKFEKKWGWYSTDLPPWIWLKDCLKSDCLNEIKNIYCNLDFSHNFKQIINDVNILAKELNNFTSIHIRGGDIIYSPLRKNAGWKVLEERYFPYEIAMEIIQESLLFGEKVVIFGQDIIANNILIKYFRDRQFKNIFLVDEIIKSKYTNFERAFFEINLMSKSNKIYAPKVSAFSRVSMLISGTDNLIPYDKKFSIKELHSIMLKNIGRLELHSLQLSRSYFYLYLLQKQINPVFSKLFLYLKKSSRLDKDNDAYRIYIIELLFQQKKYFLINCYLKNILKNRYSFFIDNLCKNSFNIFRIYYFNYIQHARHYPYINYIAIFIFIYLKNKNKILFHYNYLMKNNKIDIDLMRHINTCILNIFYNSAEFRVKNSLKYRLGNILIQYKLMSFKYIFLLFYDNLYCFNIEKKYFNIEKNKILPLEQCDDYEESLRIKKHLSYRLGDVILNSLLNWYKGYIFLLPYFIFRVYINFKKGK